MSKDNGVETGISWATGPRTYGLALDEYDKQVRYMDPQYGPEEPYLQHSTDAAARLYESLLQGHPPDEAAGLLAMLGATSPDLNLNSY